MATTWGYDGACRGVLLKDTAGAAGLPGAEPVICIT
jgi:hypothetical protein